MTIFRSIGTVYGEIFRNFKRIGRISIHDFYRRNKDTRLGFLWNILTPLIQVLIYWFVFGIGLRSGKPIAQGGTQYDYLVWLFTGLFTWIYLRGAIIDGANCIYVKYSLISKMKIPLSILSVTSVLTALLMSLPSFAIVFLFLLHKAVLGAFAEDARAGIYLGGQQVDGVMRGIIAGRIEKRDVPIPRKLRNCFCGILLGPQQGDPPLLAKLALINENQLLFLYRLAAEGGDQAV